MRRRAGAITATALTIAMGAMGQQAATAAPAPQPSPSRTAVAAKALDAVAQHSAEVRAGSGQQLRVVSVLVDPNGTTHTRMVRTYQKLNVLGGDIVVHQSKSGAWRGASRTIADAPTMSTTPKITTAAAKRAAGKGAGATALVIDARHGTPRLAYQVTATGRQADGTPSRRLVTVDATNGKVTGASEQVWTFRAPRNARNAQPAKNAAKPAKGKAGPKVTGDGKSLYSGTVPLETTQDGSQFLLKDPTRGDTYTTDLNHSEGSDGPPMTDADNHWGDGTNNDPATAGVDAQYGTNVTWDYYKTTHGRNGIGDDGKGSHNNVHYGDGYANAFWSDDCFCMTYGDGDGQQIGPLTSIDVAGHEMSHGVTSRTANLDYQGESGGLNEATSDIFGTSVEFSANNKEDVGDYLIGEEIMLQGGALRYMDKPSKDGQSLDCWSSDAGNVDVHYSSGIANHFFYLVSEGSGAKEINGVQYDSPTCDGSTVKGIGRADAEKIWYKALTAYMTSGTQYTDARKATLSAATDLFGADSDQVKGVAAAWTAVAVN